MADIPDVKYDRDTQVMDCEGLDLNRPVDSVKNNKFPYLKNVRSYQAGRMEPRFGLTEIAEVVAGQSTVHSARRLNDPNGATYTRIIGTGTHLAYGQAAFTDLDSGYSGDPLALVPWRPKASPTSFMYVADRSRMRKVGISGALHTVGLAAPSTAPSVALTDVPKYKVIDDFNANAGSWAQSGTAGAPSNLSGATARVNAVAISHILYDSGTTGWCSIVPASMAGIGAGQYIVFSANAETVPPRIQSVYPGMPTGVSDTIASIIYDSGTTGLASLVLTTPVDLSACDAIIRNTTVGPENARILSVTPGPDGKTSIRISTTNTWAATNNVQIFGTFRVYTANNHTTAHTITSNAIRTAVTSGTGSLSRTLAVDLSVIASGVPALPSDIMHISMRVSDPTVITEIKVLLDVDSATNDFTRNYYWKSFRASDITPAAANLQSLITTRQQVVQRSILDQKLQKEDAANGDEPLQTNAQDATLPADGTSAQMPAGVSQWVELTFRLSDLIRIGTDSSRTLADVAKLQITAIVTGSVNVDMDSWWIGGGYGPDTMDAAASPYLYRYRVRETSTNVASNFSPASRYSALPLRQSVTITPTQYAAPSGTSLTTSNFVIDIERFGGQIADWHYVGTIPNDASAFADIYEDDIVAGQPLMGNDNYQPWPILGTPVSGTTATIAGTTMTDAATGFSVSWAPGTRILVNNQPYTLYRVISTSKLETVENMGSKTTGVQWKVDEPTILAQPMPCLWEWDGTFFGCGDTVNPGRLYYSNPDSETTTPTNYLDLTSPSEPLMNGVQYNIRSYVFSTENLIQILQTGDPVRPFRHEQIPGGKGLFSRWALTREPAPFIDFLSKDGIYRTAGGASVNITDNDLYPLFPNEGNLGNNVNGILAPDIVSAQATTFRISHYDGFTYFDYMTQSGGRATLVNADISESGSSWFWDVYTPNVTFHYGEEGSGVHSLLCGSTGTKIYQYAGVSDAGTAFSMELTTPFRNQSDPRLNKLYGDIMLDSDTDGLDTTCTPYFNSGSASGAAVTVNTTYRQPTAVQWGSSSWTTATNIALNIVASITTKHPMFYIWEARWAFESAPIAALSWEISPTSLGIANFKSIGLCEIAHVSNSDLSLTFTLDSVAQASITIPNSGGNYQQTVFRVPVYKGKLYKIRIQSDAEFRLDPRNTLIHVKGWGTDTPYKKMRVFGDYSLVEG